MEPCSTPFPPTAGGGPTATGAPQGDGFVGIAADPGDGNAVFILRMGGHVFHATEASGEWEPFGAGGPPGGPAFTGITAARDDGGIEVYQLRNDGAVFSFTGGDWSRYLEGASGRKRRRK